MSIFNYINDLSEIAYQVGYELNNMSDKSDIEYKNKLLYSLSLLNKTITSFEEVKDILLNEQTVDLKQFLEKH